MPYVYSKDKNGRYRRSGSLSQAEVTPTAAGAGFGKPSAKRKPPKPATRPWWWHVTPEGMSNNLRYEQKRHQGFNRQPRPQRSAPVQAIQARVRVSPLGAMVNALPPSGRQMVVGGATRAFEDAGLALVNYGQRALGNVEATLDKAGVRNPALRTLLKPAFAPALLSMGLFGPSRDPEATPAGRAIVRLGRGVRMAYGARLREEMKPEDDLLEAVPAAFAANVALAPLTAGVGGVIKGSGAAAKATRWGLDLAANEAAANLITDNTMGGPSQLLKAVGVPVPDALSAAPARDDRISAAIREAPAAMAIAGPLGALLGGAAQGMGQVLEQSPNVMRSIRDNRLVQELRNARQKTVGNGLQEVDPETGGYVFTDTARTEPPPLPPPAVEPAPIATRADGFEDFGKAPAGDLPQDRNLGADPWLDDAQYEAWLKQNASLEIVPVQGTAAQAPAPPALRPLAPRDELRGEGVADPWGMGPAPNSPVQQSLGRAAGAQSSTEPPASAAEQSSAAEEFFDPELPEIDQAAVALERLEPDVLEQIAQTPGPVLPQIEGALAGRQPVTPRPELDAAAVTAPTDNLATSQFLSRREEWGNLRDAELLGVFHPEVNPDLAKLIESRTGRSFDELTRNDAVETLGYMEEQGATVIPDRLNAGMELARTADLVADPSRFQYKLNTDRRGVQRGNSLEGLEQWNTAMEGMVLVWEDPSNGRLYVVNGHNRLAKAQQLGIPTVPVKRLLARTAEQARALGAMDNIASGGGTPWDAAKFFRDAGISDLDQAKAAGLPLNSGHAEQGLQLAQLPDNIFQAGLTGELKEERAFALGASGLSPETMQSVWREYQGDAFFRTEENFQQLIDLARGAPTAAADRGGRLKQNEIPGLETAAERDLTKTLIKLSKAVEGNLRADRRALTGASRNADTLEAKGNSQIDAQAAMQAGLDTEQLLWVFEALRYMGGNEINGLLRAGTEEVAAGAKLEVVARRIQGELDQAAKNVVLPKPPEPAAPEPMAPEVPTPRGEADIEAARLTILNRAAAGGEVRPSATPIPDPPKVKPGIDLEGAATSAGQLKLAQQQRQAAVVAGDQAAVAAWDKEIRTISQGLLAADQAARDASQTGLFGETEYDTSLPLLNPRLQEEEARLAAEYRQRDAAAQADLARAEREAADYQGMTFEEKKAEFGITEGWKPPEAAPPVPRPPLAPAPAPARSFAFPRDLAKSSPRYGMATLKFASDYDRAAYIIRDASKKSKGEDQLIEALEGQGLVLAEVRAHGKRVHAAIKAVSKEQTGSTRAPIKTMELEVREVGEIADGDQGIVDSLSPRASEEPEDWMPSDTANTSAEERSLRRAFLTKIIQDVAGDDVIIRFDDVYPLVPRGPEWGGKPGEEATQLGFYKPAPPPDFVGDLIQVNGIGAADDLMPLTETAYHEAFHRIQWVALGENEAKALDSSWARLKIAIGSGHLRDSAKIAYGESMPVAVQRYATARKVGADPVQYMLGRGYQQADSKLWDLALGFFSGVDSVLDFAEKVYNSAVGNGFISTRSILEDFYQGNLIARYDYSAAPLRTAARDGWFDQTWDRKAIERLDRYTVLSSVLREADGGRLKGVSKRALSMAEDGSPDQALREATDYAQRRLAEIDDEIKAITRRAIEEGC